MQGCAIIHAKCSDCNHRRPPLFAIRFSRDAHKRRCRSMTIWSHLTAQQLPVRNYPAKNAESFEQARIILGNWISRFLLSSSHHPKPWRPHDFNFWGGGDHPAKNSCMYVVLPWVGDGIRVVSKYYYSMIFVTYR